MRHARRLDIELATKPPRSIGEQIEEIGQHVMKAREGVNEMADAGYPIVVRLEKADIRKMIHVVETTTRLAGLLAIDLTCAVPTAYFDDIRALYSTDENFARRIAGGLRMAARRLDALHGGSGAGTDADADEPDRTRDPQAERTAQPARHEAETVTRPTTLLEGTGVTAREHSLDDGQKAPGRRGPDHEPRLPRRRTRGCTQPRLQPQPERAATEVANCPDRGHQRGRIRQYAPASGPTSRTASGSPTTRRPETPARRRQPPLPARGRRTTTTRRRTRPNARPPERLRTRKVAATRGARDQDSLGYRAGRPRNQDTGTARWQPTGTTHAATRIEEPPRQERTREETLQAGTSQPTGDQRNEPRPTSGRSERGRTRQPAAEAPRHQHAVDDRQATEPERHPRARRAQASAIDPDRPARTASTRGTRQVPTQDRASRKESGTCRSKKASRRPTTAS